MRDMRFALQWARHDAMRRRSRRQWLATPIAKGKKAKLRTGRQFTVRTDGVWYQDDEGFATRSRKSKTEPSQFRLTDSGSVGQSNRGGGAVSSPVKRRKPMSEMSPRERLRHHVTGAIEHGEKEPIVEVSAERDPAHHAASRFQQMYDSALDKDFNESDIRAAVAETGNALSRRELVEAAKQFEITRALPNKAAYIKAIGDKIVRRRGTYFRGDA